MTSTPKRLISMFSGVLNWRRMLAADSVVERGAERRVALDDHDPAVEVGPRGKEGRDAAADDRAADDDDVGTLGSGSWRGSLAT